MSKKKLSNEDRAIAIMLEQIREAIATTEVPEKMVFEALVDESEGWRMRLEELEAEEDDP